MITGKEAKHLLNRLYSFFEQGDNLDWAFLNYFNHINDNIDDLYRGNGVQHTKRVNSYTKKNKKIKKLGSAHKVVFFISRKSRVIISCKN